MRRYSLCALLLCAAGLPAHGADDLDRIDDLVQAEFRLLSQDLGAALSYRAVAPVEPLGIAGFDVGVEVTATSVENRAVAGIGRVWIDSAPVGIADLEAEDFSESKYFLGANINFLVADLALEWDQVGDVSSYSAKLGFRF